jgi:hypothetical protein
MKAALCFLISYDHSLNKEALWLEWIEPNKDIINVYFHYDDYSKINSPWIQKHCISPTHVVKTSYFHVVPAYLALMSFAQAHSRENVWFIMLTESCVPIISPQRFRRLFFENYMKSIMSWRSAWWNIDFHKRANLRLFKKEYHLANDPWFVLERKDLMHCLEYKINNRQNYNTICSGGLANESIFAIILYACNRLNSVKKAVTHAADWSRMSSATSPHLFIDGTKDDIAFINKFLIENECAMFLRKVHPDFPDSILNEFILREDESAFQKYSKASLNKCIYFIKSLLSIVVVFGFVFYFNIKVADNQPHQLM